MYVCVFVLSFTAANIDHPSSSRKVEKTKQQEDDLLGSKATLQSESQLIAKEFKVGQKNVPFKKKKKLRGERKRWRGRWREEARE